MVNEEYIQELIQFGLTPEEARVYMALLEKGSNGDMVGRLKDNLEIGRTTIYGILDRLIEKGWVEGIEVKKKPKRTHYIANSPIKMLDKIIHKKEAELKQLKDSYIFIGDNLEKIFQEKKELSLENIHPGFIKYLKPLIERKWEIKSEVIERSESLSRTIFDYELVAPKGFPTNDCGLILFDYDRNIETDENLIKAALATYKSKTEYEIRNHDIPGFIDLKIEDTTFDGYVGAKVYIKVEIQKEWILAGNEAVIPIKNRLLLIHGAENNFSILFNVILKS